MSTRRTPSGTKVLAVASGGGHWVQLLRICAAFEACEIVYATAHASYRAQVGDARFYVFSDANRWTPTGLLKAAGKLLYILLTERPDVVVSTGAAPGYLALRLARLVGAKTVWLESIANVEQLSMSGRKIGPYADLWLTQWPSLARPEGPLYAGAVL